MRTPKLNRIDAFTLIELLVVIAVIGILAGLLFTVAPAVGVRQRVALARTELGEVQTALENYKARHGFYPPDNGANVLLTPLYLELAGTLMGNNGASYTTLDGSYTVNTQQLRLAFNRLGLVNSGTSVEGTDERPGPTTFLRELNSLRFATNAGIRVLACSVGWEGPGNNSAAVWRYKSSNPANNPGSYDLWVELFLRQQTNVIGNWK